jgi:hypothetical protein
MTVEKLHKLTGDLIAKRRGNAEVAIDIASFTESENGTIHVVESVKYRRIQGADDSGPVGPKFPFLVLSGE